MDAASAAPAAPATPGPPPPELTRHIESSEDLDALADKISSALPSWVTSGTGREILSGRWLGHALHPLLTDLPLGFWTSASLLDLVGSEDDARTARRLIGWGLVAALPTATTGLSDWSQLRSTGDRRTGVVHAQLNAAALALYGLSYLSRRRGKRGVLLALLGGLVASAGGYLGGHLTLDRAVTRDNTLLPLSDGAEDPAATAQPAGSAGSAGPTGF
jgi:uncharacterized membrane protein